MPSNYFTEKTHYESKIRLGKAMVDNPIYVGDGPVYESVLPSTGTQLSAAKTSKAAANNYDNKHYEILHTPEDAQVINSTARYIGQPVQPRRNSLDSSTCADLETIAKDVQCHTRSKSFSTPTIRSVALKSNGQPRNKLNLTLTLGTPTDVLSQRQDVEDPYTVMNPAASLR